MSFEYDRKKSQANKRKHGIDFEAAQALWRDEDRIDLFSKDPREDRWLVIGRIKGKHWTAIITYREQNIRIISVRRSRDIEEDAYETQQEID